MDSVLPIIPAGVNAQRRRQVLTWVGLMALFCLLLWTGVLSVDLPGTYFLALHSTLEVGSIIVAMLAFGIAWHAYAQNRPGNIVLLGAVLFGAALIDFAHTLSYAGMPALVTESSPQKAIAFWLAARYLAAFGLLYVALRPWQPLQNVNQRHWLISGVLVYVVLIYGLILFWPQHVPDFFIAGQGLTSFKVRLEYLLVAVYALAAVLFYRQSDKDVNYSAPDLFAAAAIAALSEIFFTRYDRVTDLINATGHVYKIISYYFIYRAVFVDSVRLPFSALKDALGRERQWATEQHAFVRTLDLLEEAVLELDCKGRIMTANTGWWTLLGQPSTPQISLLAFIHEEDRSAFEINLIGLATSEKDEFRGRFRVRVTNRPEQWVECRFVSERNDAGQCVGIRGVLRDITKNYLQERRITYMALHDALTGLPNRILLEDRIQQAIQQSARTGHHVGVCFIDLDHFKNINDAYGHKAGDGFLLALAQLLRSCLREGDTLARWGGDEFVVLLPDMPSSDAARQVAQKMVDAMRQTIMLDGGLAINATFSMGIAVYPEDDPEGDIERLLAQADRAMFYAKSQGRNNFQLFSDMSKKGLGKKELYIQARLAQAIRDEKITVWFQPQVTSSSSLQAPEIVGLEALARWHDPELGWISPGSFVPMAENLGLINELGQLVRRRAFAQFHLWRQTQPTLTLSVNVSKRQLFAADFIDLLMRDIQAHDLQPSMVVLEITESVALLDVEFAEERLRKLSELGFTLAIDDFGTGYASLSQLHELPISELKIDISFVRRVRTPDGLRLAQGIVSLAQALGLRTVAEGVEDEETTLILRDLGVDLLQGYHFGRPVPADQIQFSAATAPTAAGAA